MGDESLLRRRGAGSNECVSFGERAGCGERALLRQLRVLGKSHGSTENRMDALHPHLRRLLVRPRRYAKGCRRQELHDVGEIITRLAGQLTWRWCGPILVGKAEHPPLAQVTPLGMPLGAVAPNSRAPLTNAASARNDVDQLASNHALWREAGGVSQAAEGAAIDHRRLPGLRRRGPPREAGLRHSRRGGACRVHALAGHIVQEQASQGMPI
mmetsp:Transcript_41462/g.119512  ORF Transcript_41462/g.119512 Transcript_41462/m.119512 type:complete len:212 (-) Transcript_41462:735-1370(-)